jgi:hypothetical protein
MKRWVLCFLVAACGGSAEPTATTPSSTGGSSGTSAPEMSPQSVQNRNVDDSRVRINAARGELDRAESQVSAATSDCATACRALESMERAAEHLCALDSGSECGRARNRLEAARERVRASCGGCR